MGPSSDLLSWNNIFGAGYILNPEKTCFCSWIHSGEIQKVLGPVPPAKTPVHSFVHIPALSRRSGFSHGTGGQAEAWQWAQAPVCPCSAALARTNCHPWAEDAWLEEVALSKGLQPHTSHGLTRQG